MAARPTSDGATRFSTSQNPFLRQCPNYRTCVPSIARSCNPFVSPLSLRLRRIAFLCIVFMRIIEAILFAMVGAMRTPAYLVPGMIITILIFFLVAWNLHLIVEAEGSRKVMGVTIPSGALTAFLWFMVAVHVVLVGLEVTGLSWFIDGTLRIWGVMISMMCLAAWIATREPEEGSLSLA